MFSRNRFLKSVWVKILDSVLCASFFFSSVPASMAQSASPLPANQSNALSGPSAFFDTIRIPENVGKIRERFIPSSTSSDKAVILIQDAHCNLEAHQNIRNLLNVLVKENGLSFIGVEGAKGMIDYDSFYVGTKEQRESFCSEYMQKGLITGLESFALVDGEGLPFTVYGLEEKIPYLQNFIALKDTFEERQRSSSFIDSLIKSADDLKNKVYPPALKEIDQKHSDFLDGKLKQSDYILYLSGLLESKNFQTDAFKTHFNDQQTYPNFKKLQECIVMEKSIDFSRMEAEQNLITQNTVKQLSGDELTKLNEMNEKFSSKSVTSDVYYSFLQEYITRFDLTASCPNITRFIQLRRMFDEVKTENVREEVRDIAFNLQFFSCENEDQKTLVLITRYLYVISRLVELRLTRDQLAYYIDNEDSFSLPGAIQWLKTKSEENALSWPRKLDESQFSVSYSISSASDYYRNLLNRDRIMVHNLLQAQDLRGEDKSILIAGGFHTEGMAKLLKDQNIPYLIISPKVGKPTDTYYEVMMNLSVDMNSLFESEHNGLAPPLMLGNGLNLKSYLSIRDIYAKIFNTDDPKVLDKLMQEKLQGDKKLLPQQKADLSKIIKAALKSDPDNKKLKKALGLIKSNAGLKDKDGDETASDTKAILARNSQKTRFMEYLKSKLKRFSRDELDAELKRIDEEGGTGSVRIEQLLHPVFGIFTKDKNNLYTIVDAQKAGLQQVLGFDFSAVNMKSISDAIGLCEEMDITIQKSLTLGLLKTLLQGKITDQEIETAFNKLTYDQIQDVLSALKNVNAQGLDSASFVLKTLFSEKKEEDLTALKINPNEAENLWKTALDSNAALKNLLLMNKMISDYSGIKKDAELLDLLRPANKSSFKAEQQIRAFDQIETYYNTQRQHNYFQYELTRQYQDTLHRERDKKDEFLGGIYHAFGAVDSASFGDLKGKFEDYAVIGKLIEKEREPQINKIKAGRKDYVLTAEERASITEGKLEKALREFLTAEKMKLMKKTTGKTREEAEKELKKDPALMAHALAIVNASISINSKYSSLKDMQLVAALGAFSGRNVLELATGEGKTQVSIATAFLNSLAHTPDGKGFGSLVVTTKDSSAMETYSDSFFPFRMLGVTAGVIQTTEGVSPEKQQEILDSNKHAYTCDVTVVSTTQFHFNVLEDKFIATDDTKKNVQRDFSNLALIIDEFDSVMIHQARTEYIMSGSSSLTSRKMSEEYFTNELKISHVEFQKQIADLIETKLGGDVALSQNTRDYLKNEILEKIKAGHYTTDQMKYILAYIACMKQHKLSLDFKKKENDPELVSKMPDLSFKQIFNESPVLADVLKKLFPTEAEWQNYLKEQMNAKKNFRRDVDYGLEPLTGEVKLIDSKTGTYQNSVRLQADVNGGGGHIALELLNCVSIKEDTVTTASLSSRDLMSKGQIGKVSGMTGTASQTSKSQASLYGVEYLPLPTSTPVIRKDYGLEGLEKDDLPQKLPIFDTDADMLEYMTKSVIQDVQRGQPVLIFASNDSQGEDIFLKLSARLNEKITTEPQTLKIFQEAGRVTKNEDGSFSVLLNQYFAAHAQSPELESKIINREAGKPGAITIVTNIGGRGTDFKLIGASKSKGFHTYGYGYIEGDDLEKQRRGRSGRQGAMGITEELISRADVERISKIGLITMDLSDEERLRLEKWVSDASIKIDSQLSRIIQRVIKKSQQIEVERLGEQIEKDSDFAQFKYQQQTEFKKLKDEMTEKEMRKFIAKERIGNSHRKFPEIIKTGIDEALADDINWKKIIEQKFGISMEGFPNVDTKNRENAVIHYVVMSLSMKHWENTADNVIGKWFKDILKEKQNSTSDTKKFMKTLSEEYSLSKLLKQASKEKIFDDDLDFFEFVELQMKKQEEKKSTAQEKPKNEFSSVFDELTKLNRLMEKDKTAPAEEKLSTADRQRIQQRMAELHAQGKALCDQYNEKLDKTARIRAHKREDSDYKVYVDNIQPLPADWKKSRIDYYRGILAEKKVQLDEAAVHMKGVKISPEELARSVSRTRGSENQQSMQRMKAEAALYSGGQKLFTSTFKPETSAKIAKDRFQTKKTLIEDIAKTKKGKIKVTAEEKKAKEIFKLLNSKSRMDSDTYKTILKLSSKGDMTAIDEAFKKLQKDDGSAKDIADFITQKFNSATDAKRQFRVSYLNALLKGTMTDEMTIRELLGEGGLKYEESSIFSSVVNMNPQTSLKFLMDEQLASKSEVFKNTRFINELKAMVFSKLWTEAQIQATAQNKKAEDVFSEMIAPYSKLGVNAATDSTDKQELTEDLARLLKQVSVFETTATQTGKTELSRLKSRIEFRQKNAMDTPAKLTEIREEVNRMLLIMHSYEHLHRLQMDNHVYFKGETYQEQLSDASLYFLLKMTRSGVKDKLSFKGSLYSVFSDSDLMDQYTQLLKNNKEAAESLLKVLQNQESAVSTYLKGKQEKTLHQWLIYKTKAAIAKTEEEKAMNESLAYVYEKKKNPVSAWFNKTFIADKENAMGIVEILSKLDSPSEALMRYALAEGKIELVQFNQWMDNGKIMTGNALFESMEAWFSSELQKAGIEYAYIQPLMECPKGGVAFLEVKDFLRSSKKAYRLDFKAPLDINAKRLAGNISKLTPEAIAYFRRNTQDLLDLEKLARSPNAPEVWNLIKEMLGIDRNMRIQEYIDQKNLPARQKMQVSQEDLQSELKNVREGILHKAEFLAAKVRYERRGLFMQMGANAEWLDTKIPFMKYSRKEVTKLILEAQRAAKEEAQKGGIDQQTVFKNYMMKFSKLCLGNINLTDAELTGLISKNYQSEMADFFLGNKEITMDDLLRLTWEKTRSASDAIFAEYALRQASFSDLFAGQNVEAIANQIKILRDSAQDAETQKRQMIELLTNLKPELKDQIESHYTKRDQLALKEAAYERMIALLEGMSQNAQFNDLLTKAGLRAEDLKPLIHAQYLQIRQARIENIKLPDKIWISNVNARRLHAQELNQKIAELKDAMAKAAVGDQAAQDRLNDLARDIGRINASFKQEQTEYFQYLEKIATRTKSIVSMIITTLHVIADIVSVALFFTGVFSWAGVLLFSAAFTGLSIVQALFNFTIDRIFLSWKTNTATSVFSLLTSFFQAAVKVGMDTLFTFLKILTAGLADVLKFVVRTALAVAKLIINFIINQVVKGVLQYFLPEATNDMVNSNLNMLGFSIFNVTDMLESYMESIYLRFFNSIINTAQDIYRTASPVSDTQTQQQAGQQQTTLQIQVNQRQTTRDVQDAILDLTGFFEPIQNVVAAIAKGGAIGIANDAVITREEGGDVNFKTADGKWTATAKTQTADSAIEKDVTVEIKEARAQRLTQARDKIQLKFSTLLTDKETSELCTKLKLNPEKLAIALKNISSDRLFAFAKTKNQEGEFVLGAGIQKDEQNGEIGFDEEFLLKLLDSDNEDLIMIALFHEALESVTDVGTHDTIRELQKTLFDENDKKLTCFIRSFNLARNLYENNPVKQKDFHQNLYNLLSQDSADSYESIIKLLSEGECNLNELMSVIELLQKSNDKKKLGEFRYSKKLVETLLSEVKKKDQSFTAFDFLKNTFKKMGLSRYEIRDIESSMNSLFKDLQVKDEKIELTDEQKVFLGLLGKRLLVQDKDTAKVQSIKLANTFLLSFLNRDKILAGESVKVLNEALMDTEVTLDTLKSKSQNHALLMRLSQQNLWLEKMTAFEESESETEFVFNKNVSLVKEKNKLILKLKNGTIYTDEELKAHTGMDIRQYVAFQGACRDDLEAFTKGLELRNLTDSLLETKIDLKSPARQTLIDISEMTEESEIRETVAFIKKVIAGGGEANHKIYSADEDTFVKFLENVKISGLKITEEDLRKVLVTGTKLGMNKDVPLMMITKTPTRFSDAKGCIVLNSKNSLQASMVGLISFISKDTKPLEKLKETVDNKDAIDGLLKCVADDKIIMGFTKNEVFEMPVMKPIMDSILSQLADEEETVMIAG